MRFGAKFGLNLHHVGWAARGIWAAEVAPDGKIQWEMRAGKLVTWLAASPLIWTSKDILRNDISKKTTFLEVSSIDSR